MRTVAIVAMAAVMLAAGAFRVRSYLRTRSSGTLYLAVAANAVGLAVFLNAPGPYQWFDRVVFGAPNASALISHVLTVIGAAAAAKMVTTLVTARRPDRRPIRLGGAALIIAVMITTFVLAAPGREDALFFEHYKTDSRLTVYWTVFFGSVILQLAYVAILTLRYTHHDDRWLGRGLRLIGCGSICAALFLTTRLAELATASVTPASDAFAIALLGLACVLLATGVLLPQAGMITDRVQSQKKLHPLWDVATAEFPYVRAQPARMNLYRTVVEIQDALAEARSHHQVNTPALIALDSLPTRPADQFDTTVRDLLSVATSLSAAGLPSTRPAPR